MYLVFFPDFILYSADNFGWDVGKPFDIKVKVRALGQTAVQCRGLLSIK
jgi:hypothetical protein